jgi:glutathione S-transferase
MQRVAFERVQKAAFGRGAPDEAVIAAEMKNVDQFLDVLEVGLGHGKDWIAGNLSLADFAIATTFMYRVRAGISLDTRPRVAAWIGRMDARESWKKATGELPPLPKPAG